MPVQFLDDVAWRQRKDTVWSVNSAGCDQGRILFRGSRLLRAAFLNTLPKWGPMPGQGFMFMENYSDGEGTVSFPGIEATYTGFKSGGPPQVKYTDGTSVQSASASGTNSDGDKVSGTFTYKCSRTTWVWFETVPPNPLIPRYGSVHDPISPFNNILTYQIQDDAGTTKMVPYSDFVTLFNSLVAGTFVSNYERELVVPGRLWACHSDVDYKFI